MAPPCPYAKARAMPRLVACPQHLKSEPIRKRDSNFKVDPPCPHTLPAGPKTCKRNSAGHLYAAQVLGN